MSICLFNIRVDDISQEKLEQKLYDWIVGQTQRMIVTPNPEFLLAAKKDKNFADILNQADLSLPDGIGLRFAACALTEETLKYRHTGVDTLDLLASICEKTNKCLFLLGGYGNSAQKTGQYFQKKYPDLRVVSVNPGKINQNLPVELMEKINQSGATVLAVGFGQKKQEFFLKEYLPLFDQIKIAIGVGGAFEMLSGTLPRAPLWMRQNGLEWLWRLLIEPRRFPRIIRATIIFPIFVILSTIKQKRFWKACVRVGKEFIIKN
ncbi:hypothetical protein CO172_00180 [Candidatus Uhrbacteria bacterium CG_4_9_14_3_um_filter_36_7]|uniref:Glycosyltransferase n=1 Tax=Candidatus Uhrbacteria bacterium CG_4_9_14_3_um_filter_36_7 TaxID=1975033 RepID=A0A2M7XID6_9BACT|nr:MAG: hypothetical protein CO172_00180 [Candidatus Uhrbacteria bacterium CG_4_9_14_3_um_filter_36_7]